jgi:hypothetical protein
VEVLVRSIGTLISSAADAEVPLVFRGVINVGDMFVVENEDRDENLTNILIGPAINKAPALDRQALGAFVWLTQAAAKLPFDDVEQGTDSLVWYRVPTKTCGLVHTRVVNPF